MANATPEQLAARRMRKREQRIQRTTSKALVESVFGGVANPLVAITYVSPKPVRGWEFFVPKAMGFVTEVYPNGYRLVCTSAHANVCRKNGYRELAVMCHPLPTEVRIINSVVDEQDGSDVEFLLIHDPKDAPTRPLTLSPNDPAWKKEEFVLYNARNQCEPTFSAFHPDVSLQSYEVVIARQVTSEAPRTAYTKLSEKRSWSYPTGDLAAYERYTKAGWLPCRQFGMTARPGNSGSPLWDDDLTLYGLNQGGSSPDQPGYVGDILNCVPTSYLHGARMRLDSRIKTMLSNI